MNRFLPMALIAVLLAHLVSAANNPECFSTTDQYIVRSFTVIQPSNVLIQRYRGSQIKLFCSSFEEVGPSCPALLPTLCSRPAGDPSAQMKCETLAEFGSDINAGVSRGSINGPQMLWLLQWDGTQLPPSCFPRVVNARLLAFVYNENVASTAVFVILLIIAIVCVALILLSFVHQVRSRWLKIDTAGATAIAGPKMSFRGPQLGVTEPGAALPPGVTKVYLPVRDSGALNDMTADRMGALLSDPNTPRGKSIYLQNADGEVDRGPGSSMRRRRRASPPAPGDGTFDVALQQRIADARRVTRRVGGGGQHEDEGDEDAFDYAFDDEGPIDFDDTTTTGQARIARWQEAADRRRAQNPTRKKKDARVPQRGALFPTQRNWTTGGGGDDEDSAYAAYRSGGDEPVGDDEDGAPGGPGAPGSRGGAPRPQVKYIPQWMYGSFGRGGVIPELGDGEEEEEAYRRAAGTPQNGQGRQPSIRRGPGNEVVAKQYYQKPAGGPGSKGKENSGFDDETIIISENGQMRQVPRSALKGRRGQPGGNTSGADSGAEDAIRRGVSFRGDYVGGDASRDGGAQPGARQFTPSLTNPGVTGPRGGGPGPQGSRAKPADTDQFARAAARVHNRTLDLVGPSERPELQAGVFNDQHGNDRSATGGPTTSRLTVVGRDSEGNPVYAAGGAFGSVGGVDGLAAFQCADCSERIQPGSVSYCPVTGKRHY